MGAIIGEHVRKIIAENKGIARKMTISNNIKITDVRKADFAVGEGKQPGIAFDFLFAATYGETPSKIEVEGTIFYTAEKKELEEIEKEWKDKKVVLEKIALPINNRALEIGFLQSIALANQVRLPAPLQLPRFVQGKPEEAKKK